MSFTLCEMYSEIASLHFFERSAVALIYVTDSIRAVWTRNLFVTKIVSQLHLSAKCEHCHNRDILQYTVLQIQFWSEKCNAITNFTKKAEDIVVGN